MSLKLQIQPADNRRGAATVEFALVLPLLITLIFGSVELGRAVMVQHVLEEAARAGCRVATLHEGSKADAEKIVDTAMANADISGYTTTIVPDPPTNAGRKNPVAVTVTVPYDQISWMPSSWFMSGKTLNGSCTMPAERDVSSSKSKKQKAKQKKQKAKKQKQKNSKAKHKAKKAKKVKAKSKKSKTAKTKKVKGV